MLSSAAKTAMFLLGLGATVGCTGTVHDGSFGGGDSTSNGTQGGKDTGSTGAGSTNASPTSKAAGALVEQVVRRLTREEYNNTVRDLLGDQSQPADGFAPENEVAGFHNNTSAQSVSTLLAQQIYETGVAVASAAVKRSGVLPECSSNPSAPGDACASQFIADLGARAWRRPLTLAEQASLKATFQTGAKVSAAHGYELVLQALLVSPSFLFRIESQAPATGSSATPVRPSSWEMATRLSFALWNTMPDAQLFAAARANSLQTQAQIAGETARMLKDVKARDMTLNFFRQWLNLKVIAAIRKDTSLFPRFINGTGALLQKESEMFVQDAVWGKSPGLRTLMQGTSYFADQKLARYYGLDVSGMTDTLVETPGRKGERSGVLTLGGLMATLAKTDQTLPPARGKFVREKFLCLVVPPPPPNVNNAVPPPQPGVTVRQRFMQHDQATCATCHRLMDPVGFGLENFDAAGAFRTSENGMPVDDTGEVVGVDSIGAFKGAAELSTKILASKEFRSCFAVQAFRFAFGREESDADARTLTDLAATMSAGNGDEIVRLFAALTTTRDFQMRSSEQ